MNNSTTNEEQFFNHLMMEFYRLGYRLSSSDEQRLRDALNSSEIVDEMNSGLPLQRKVQRIRARLLMTVFVDLEVMAFNINFATTLEKVKSDLDPSHKKLLLQAISDDMFVCPSDLSKINLVLVNSSTINKLLKAPSKAFGSNTIEPDRLSLIRMVIEDAFYEVNGVTMPRPTETIRTALINELISDGNPISSESIDRLLDLPNVEIIATIIHCERIEDSDKIKIAKDYVLSGMFPYVDIEVEVASASI